MKVVYNACHGGFSLSREAVLLARQISGDPNWGGPSIVGDRENDGSQVKTDYGFLDDVSRHDPVLVRVVEELGDRASGKVAMLRIAELPDRTPYRIDEYDGNETVATASSYEWVTP